MRNCTTLNSDAPAQLHSKTNCTHRLSLQLNCTLRPTALKDSRSTRHSSRSAYTLQHLVRHFHITAKYQTKFTPGRKAPPSFSIQPNCRSTMLHPNCRRNTTLQPNCRRNTDAPGKMQMLQHPTCSIFTWFLRWLSWNICILPAVELKCRIPLQLGWSIVFQQLGWMLKFGDAFLCFVPDVEVCWAPYS